MNTRALLAAMLLAACEKPTCPDGRCDAGSPDSGAAAGGGSPMGGGSAAGGGSATGGGGGATGGGTATGGGGGATCGLLTCSGCCAGNACVPIAAQTPASCGRNGAACAVCPGSEICRTSGVNPGTCVPPMISTGGPCTSDADCGGVDVSNPNGGPAFCLKVESQLLPGATQLTPGAPYPGGYCTRLCFDDLQCGVRTLCAPFGGLWGEALNVCVKLCDLGAGCRPGYACYSGEPFIAPTGACVPSNLPDGGLLLFDAGLGPSPATLGKDCTSDDECRGETGYGLCLSSMLSDGGPTGYGAGECLADCTMAADNGWCNGGALGSPNDGGAYCDAVSVKGPTGLAVVRWRCMKGCGSDADCKTGYSCRVDGFGDKACLPNCDNPGASASCPVGCLSAWGCFTDFTCNPVGHNCQ